MKPNHNTVVQIADSESLKFRDLAVPQPSPTGAQILEAANATQTDVVLLQRLPSGDLESIRLAESPDLSVSNEFILSFGDRSYFMKVDEAQMEWATRHISGASLRKLAQVSESVDLLQLRPGSAPHLIAIGAIVDLVFSGTETFVTRAKGWKLRVQGITMEYDVQHVKVGDAMKRAGFDPLKAWDIYLLIAGQPKRKVDINFDVDLSTPGIERIRLMQRNVDNGDVGASKPRREFSILPVDEVYLDATGLKWETTKCDERRWLVIEAYPLLLDYAPATATLALDIPKDYPQAQIDMFYFFPAVARSDGAAIPSTQVTAAIHGVQFQGWSRHRNSGHPWDPFSDNVATQLALVEHALAREFGE